jgi:hypothetical protein
MLRIARNSLALMLGALGTPLAAAAADWTTTDFRGAYVDDWALPADDAISIEMGTRYWYALGAHRMDVIGDSYASDDASHIIELHLRIDDLSTGFYLKGLAGYAAAINSSYSTPATGGTVKSQSGNIGYVGADIGYAPVATDGFRFGGFVGYQYWNDSPDMGRQNFLLATGGGASEPNNLHYNMLRLGLTGTAELGDMFDITAEAAVIPYASVGGTYGAFTVSGPGGNVQGSAAELSGGWLYGAAGEVMARFHPTENWTIGVGGRAWYLKGEADVNFSTRDPLSPGDQQDWITKTEEFSTLRYGLLGEITYRF